MGDMDTYTEKHVNACYFSTSQNSNKTKQNLFLKTNVI